MKYLFVILITSTFVTKSYSLNKEKKLGKNAITIACDSSEIVMPNIFTPNVDGFNDGFNIKADCIKSINKKIYNRWGELIFESEQIAEIWDGRTSTGVESPEGTYFYIFDVVFLIERKETPQIFKGSVTLIR